MCGNRFWLGHLKTDGVSIHCDSVHIMAAALSGQAQQRLQAALGEGEEYNLV